MAVEVGLVRIACVEVDVDDNIDVVSSGADVVGNVVLAKRMGIVGVVPGTVDFVVVFSHQ